MEHTLNHWSARLPLYYGWLIFAMPLISVLPPHHRRLSCRRLLSRNHCSLGSSSPFSTASVKLRRTHAEHNWSASPLGADVQLMRHVGGSGPLPDSCATTKIIGR